MKKHIFLLFLSLSLSTFIGCEDDLDANISNYNYIAFSDTEVDLLVDEDSNSSASYYVAVSKKSSSDRTFNLIVDETASDADPLSYTIPSSITIPANSTSTTLDVAIEDINIISSKTLVLKLEEQDGLFIGNDNMLTINIIRVCESDLAGEYTYSNGKAVTITETAIGTYTVSGDDYFGSNYSFDIDDSCDVISVTGGTLTEDYGIAVSGTGLVMADESIEITYTVDGYFSDRTMILTKN
ncbi:hypothetical protein [Polaribacter sargassicola]|uniref:hypothetical protein n=1 Tax=Polaribacter sargassicola TaxID=2836891 RepID=UPI001F26ED53|nr:hypothetical protein [Polaribacter sp. DS7-9]MCG1035705.1 hypothetical protein [Polaribacter sp. DS7-9]